MSDKEIYEKLMSGDIDENIVMTGDDGQKYEMEPVGMIPLYGVTYAVMNLLKINGVEAADKDNGVIILELDKNDEENECYVSAVDDDDLFEAVMDEFEKLPITK